MGVSPDVAESVGDCSDVGVSVVASTGGSEAASSGALVSWQSGSATDSGATGSDGAALDFLFLSAFFRTSMFLGAFDFLSSSFSFSKLRFEDLDLFESSLFLGDLPFLAFLSFFSPVGTSGAGGGGSDGSGV